MELPILPEPTHAIMKDGKWIDGYTPEEVRECVSAAFEPKRIESAPRDRDVLVFNGYYGWYRSRAVEHEGRTLWPLYGIMGRKGGVWFPVPSYWMDVPPPPVDMGPPMLSSTMPQFPEDDFKPPVPDVDHP